jgi:hypothetical protein
MPFTVNVGPYQGGNFLFQGLSGLGQAIGGGAGKALEQYQQNQKLDTFNEAVMRSAVDAGEASEDDWQKFMASSRTQKTHMAANLAASFTHKQQQAKLAEDVAQTAAAQAQTASSQAALNRANAGLSWVPTEQDRTTAQQMGYNYVWDPTKGFTLQPYQGSDYNTKWTPTKEQEEAAKQGGYQYLPTPKGVELKKIEGQSKIEPFTPPGTSTPLPNTYSVTNPDGTLKIVTLPSQQAEGYTPAEMTNIFKDFGVQPAQMFDSDLHHGFDDNNKAVPWEKATKIRIGNKGPLLPKDVFENLKSLAAQRANVPVRGKRGQGVIATPGSVPGPNALPSVGDTRTIGGVTYEWDGKGWIVSQ